MGRTQLRGSQIGDGTITNADIADNANIDISKINGLSSALSSSTLPSQTGNSGKFLTTNGTSASWASADGDRKSAIILAIAGRVIDLTIADTLYIEVAGSDTITINKYDGKLKTVIIYSTSTTAATITLSDGVSAIKTLNLSAATTAADGRLLCNGIALALIGDSGEIPLALIGDRKTILPIEIGVRDIRVLTSTPIPALTSLIRISRTNRTMKLGWSNSMENTIVIFATKSTTAPTIDVNNINKNDLQRCSDFATAPTIQGAKMLVCGCASELTITGLSPVTIYSFTLYQYRESLKYGVASGWSAATIFENQNTSI